MKRFAVGVVALCSVALCVGATLPLIKQSVQAAAACNDGRDNDGDGLTDYAGGAGDPGCTNVADPSEATGPLSAPGWDSDTANGRTVSTYSTPGTGGCPSSVGAWVSGTPGSPTVYKWCDYQGGHIVDTIHDVTCYGCRFSSNNTADANVRLDGDNITFSYCLFESSVDRDPPTTYLDSYQYGINYRCSAGASGLVVDHSEFESFGNGIEFGCPMVVEQSWFHDARGSDPEAIFPDDCPDLGYSPGQACDHHDGIGPSNDGFDFAGGVIDHNRVESKGNTQAIAFQYSGTEYSNVNITNGYYSGFGWTISMGDDAHCNSCSFTGNTIATTIEPVFGWFRGEAGTWSNNKLEVEPNPSPWAGGIFSNSDDGKFWCSNGTFSATNCN